MKLSSVLVILVFLYLDALRAKNNPSDPTCLDESGQSVDWIIIYKFPPIKFYNLTSGKNYAYLSSNDISKTGKWILSEQNISSKNSLVSKILDPVIKKKQEIAYLVYNDAVPNEKHYNTNFGHTKGVLAFGNYFGYWMIHSTPKFPQEGYYFFPKGSEQHGQIFICVNYNLTTINQIGEQLRYMKPHIYMNHSNSAVSKLSPLVQTLFTNKPSFVNHSPWTRNVTFSSKLGARFTSFSKHAKFLKDLYTDFVAPVLKSSLYTETWMEGGGTPLHSNCSILYPVWNIKEINISTYNREKINVLNFHSSVDHSKWAISSRILNPWVCIGDINRMKSQEKRGGGTLCLHSPWVWKAFKSTISEIECCFINSTRCNNDRYLTDTRKLI